MSNGPEQDLTGSRIVADKPVAVVSGNHCANIPATNRWCDYVVEMELPVMSWGRSIPVGKVPNRTYSGIVRIFTSERNNRIYRDGNLIATISNVGGVIGEGWQEMRVYSGKGSKSAMFSADKPFSITYYNPGVEEDNPRPNSDPFIMAMTPVEQFRTQILFCTPAVAGGLNFPENYINLIYEVDENGFVPADMMFAEVKQGKYEWAELKSKFPDNDDPFIHEVDGKQYALKTIMLPHDGVYAIKAEKPFACYSFGYSSYDSYGYPTAAMILDNSKPDTSAPVVDFIVDCLGSVDAVVSDAPDDKQLRTNLSMIYLLKDLSFNYEIETEDFIPGNDRTANWKLSVIDPNSDARAVVSLIDRSGNDTIIRINYYSNAVSVESDYDGNDSVSIADEKEYEFILTNESEKDIVINSIYFENPNGEFTLDFDTNLLPVTLTESQEIAVKVGFFSMEQGQYTNTLKLSTDCGEKEIAEVDVFVGYAAMSISFSQFRAFVGDSLVGSIGVINDGTLRLGITDIIGPSNDVFSMGLPDIDEQNPLYLSPRQDTSFQLIFKPTAAKYYIDSIEVIVTIPHYFSIFSDIRGNGLINSVDSFEDNEMNLLIIPNPANNVISVRFNNLEYGIHTAKIISIEGNPVIITKRLDLNEFGQNTVDVDISRIPQGAYYVQVEFNGKVMTGKFTVVR